MLRFFQHIRKTLMEQNKVKTYLLYALGEILLVVIGILIALQVNNWNQIRMAEQELQLYFRQIHNELSSDIPAQEEFIERNVIIIQNNTRSLHLLNSGNPDSLKQLQYTLGAFVTSWSSTISYPILTEFIENGHLSRVSNQELKQKIFEFNSGLEFITSFDSYNQNQYQHNIEPFVARSFNYQQVALDQYQQWLVPGGPETDFIELGNNLELWNLITLKLELASQYNDYLKKFLIEIKELNELLEQEIINK